MKNQLKTLKTIALATSIVVAGGLIGTANANPSVDQVKLLTANFAPRQVVQVEAGDFHFKPGQVAPVHTHDAPAIGYVAKGMIIYQVEGEKPQILREGDAFFEPTDSRILRFDNASATEEAIFIDFNLEQENEPFIVFEEAPKEHIDRRTLPTVTLKDEVVDQVEVYSNRIAPSADLELTGKSPTLGLVAQGIVEVQFEGAEPLRVSAGGTFALPTADSRVSIANVSDEVSAKVITFQLN
jgi:quercetin dioxygenase-like cupin family protein